LFVVGGTSFVATVAAARRWSTSVDLTILAGGTLSVWIAVEMALLRHVSWLHVLYGGLGLFLLALGAHAGWSSGVSRHRWVIGVTLAEGIGFLAPAVTALLATGADAGPVTLVALVVVAGWVEGLTLGIGQGRVLPVPVRRVRFALLTATGAGIAWASALSFVAMADAAASGNVPLAWGLIALPVALLSVGFFQWVELRHHDPQARAWVAWSALAWGIALPCSFSPSPFVDETTPLSVQLVLWSSAGLLMAYVYAWAIWPGARQLGRRAVVIRRTESSVGGSQVEAR
jgi:hypothetical protein